MALLILPSAIDTLLRCLQGELVLNIIATGDGATGPKAHVAVGGRECIGGAAERHVCVCVYGMSSSCSWSACLAIADATIQIVRMEGTALALSGKLQYG